MKLADVDSKKLLPLLDSLSAAIEEVLLAGLTAASEATRKTLGVTFQEATRMRLLRLGATLRVANEEIGRFTRNEAEFSKQRLSFFLGRAWLLSRGIAKAVRNSDDTLFARLMHAPMQQPVKELQVVNLGVVKKHAKNSFCAFDFRLRTVKQAGDLSAGQPLVWSCVFPLKPGVEIPPEGFLHLPQKQKFKPHLFLERKVVNIANAVVAFDDRGSGRLSLGEKSIVATGDEFGDWPSLFQWNPTAVLDNVENYQAGPFDLEIDLQDEVVLEDWDFANDKWQTTSRKSLEQVPVECNGVTFQLSYSQAEEGDSVKSGLKDIHKKKKRPQVYGLMHYASCELVVQPLTVLAGDKPQYLTISEKNVDRAALLSALKF